MIGYAMLGTNDLAGATKFYDATLVLLGMSLVEDAVTYVGYAPDGGTDIALYLTNPFDERSAAAGNGSMLSFKADSRAAVARFHQTALGLDAKDEGAPGERVEEGNLLRLCP